ncbi:VOC family protein [Kordiimonas sp. SCSIO 12610]|uniref:VOC family protein n=1 Tax=Kordiimonas sp. SCSIO 12610 TaxID=2829597 RepID=UPI00210B7C21|nr:VOC family protein [Kordiimonas sp. SCSIO 12610]UTW55132.1 VOC family protein [Kordiimonas sp. SCSIO 12610]
MKKFTKVVARVFTLVCLAVGLSASVTADDCPPSEVSLDHVIWAVPDLDEYAVKFEEKTGIKPVYGGEHTNGVTANYLVALGDCIYLEIVGPKQGVDLSAFGEAAEKYRKTSIIGFAFGVQDMTKARKTFAERGIVTGDPREGGRNKPDGAYVGWKTTNFPASNFGDNNLVFAIEWRTKPHPASTSPKGLRIVKLLVQGISAPGLDGIVNQYAMPIELTQGPRVRFALQVATPKGIVTLD